MKTDLIIVVISAGGPILIAVTALLLNYRGFSSIDSRFSSLERRLENIENDLKHFYRELADNEADIQRLKDKAGLQ
jgi:signal transduction histidine kinase